MVAGAERHAGELLGVGTARWHHSAGVATAAASLSRMFSEEDAELLVAAAWLHDIGYCAELLDTGFHPLDAPVTSAHSAPLIGSADSSRTTPVRGPRQSLEALRSS